ncbi:MAG: hypothetical protein HGN29_18660 [Asgard group archaeon]|nr:hypothetical protein [Asgard group archaeon]
MENGYKIKRFIFSFSFISILFFMSVFFPVVVNNAIPSENVGKTKSNLEEDDATPNNWVVYHSYVTDMYLWEDKLFISLEDIVFILDVSDLANPKILSQIDFSGSSISKIIGNNEFLYVFKRTEWTRLLDIFSIHDPVNPSKLCELENITTPFMSGFFDYLDIFQHTKNGQSYLVLSMPYEYIRIVNTSLPSLSYGYNILAARDYLDFISGHYFSVHINGTSLFGLMWFDNLTESRMSLVKYNITDFSNPQLLSCWNGTADIFRYINFRMAFKDDLLILTAKEYNHVYCFRMDNNSALIPLSNESLNKWIINEIVPYRNYLFTIKGGHFLIYEVDNDGVIWKIYSGVYDSDRLVFDNDTVFLSRMKESKGFELEIYNATDLNSLIILSYLWHTVDIKEDPKWPIYLSIFSAPIGFVLIVGVIVIVLSKRKRKLKK